MKITSTNYIVQAEAAARMFAEMIQRLRDQGLKVTIWSAGEATVEDPPLKGGE